MSGKKTMECRLGHLVNSPIRRVKKKDLLWLKEVGGPIRGVASAESVYMYDKLSPELIEAIRSQWNDRIQGPADFWESKRTATCGTLIGLADVCPMKPFKIIKKDQRAWVTLASPPVPGKPIQPVRSRG